MQPFEDALKTGANSTDETLSVEPEPEPESESVDHKSESVERKLKPTEHESESATRGSESAAPGLESGALDSKSAVNGSAAAERESQSIALGAESAESGSAECEPARERKQDGDITCISDMAAHGRAADALKQSAASLVGKTLNGHFEILALVGEGGMSLVYKAKDVLLNKIVAVKILRPNLLHQPNIARRLQVEARATSALSHPNTIGVRHFDVTNDGLPYLVMVYTEGISIGDLIAKEGPIEPQRAVKIVRQIADALGHAHGKGVIHRDLKATNVLITDQDGKPDTVKVMDFGIAKILNPDGVDVAAQLTTTGEIFGSPIAMSPEQCKGGKIDERSDVYALGCLMYQMLTGQPVFLTKNNFELLFKQLYETPESFKNANPYVKIPPELEAITFKALQKDCESRYQAMNELIADLDSLERRNPASALTGRWRLAAEKIRAHRRLTFLASLAVSCILLIFVWTVCQQLTQESLLNSIVPWEASQLPPLRKETPRAAIKPAVVDALKEIENNENDFRSVSARPENIAVKEREERELILKIKEPRDVLLRNGAYDELNIACKAVCDAATSYDKLVQPSIEPEKIRSTAMSIKEFGDDLFRVGLFPQAELMYWRAMVIAQKYCGYGSADDQYFAKFVADCAYKEAEYGVRQDGYERARDYYARIFPTKNDLKMVDRDLYCVDRNGMALTKVGDLAYSPLAWDARMKRAECQYRTHKYAQAIEDYQWIFLHEQPETMQSDEEIALLHWHAADCLRLTAINQSGGAESYPNDALKNYKEGQLFNRRMQDPNARNTALCHAYMVALVEHFDHLTEELPQDLSAASALSEMQRQFGDADRATVLFVSQQAADLWKDNKWPAAIRLWIYVAWMQATHSYAH